MNRAQSKRLLCIALISVFCASCASLKPVPDKSATTVPVSADSSGRAIPGAETTAPATPSQAVSESDIASLKALLLTSSDLPAWWVEDTSVAEVIVGPSPALGFCIEENVPDELASVAGSTFNSVRSGFAAIGITSYLYRTASDAQASLTSIDEYAPGMRFNKCFTDSVESIFSSSTPARVEDLRVPGIEEEEDLAARFVAIIVAMPDSSDPSVVSYINWVITVSVRGRVLTMITVLIDDTAMVDQEDTVMSAYKTLTDRLLNSSLAA